MKFVILFLACIFKTIVINSQIEFQPYNKIVKGADQLEKYLPLLKNKKIGVVTNATGIINKTHIVDTLLSLKVKITAIFCPEHGFRGDADAGISIKNNIDAKSKLPIISLYGSHYEPTTDDFKNIDLILFDIQDVGVRFYTYLSTLSYVLSGSAKNNVPIIVLDRPNPNGFYIAGPVLQSQYKSFLGLHPIPLVYGMTIGEYAKMLVGENWIAAIKSPSLTVIPLKNYDRKKFTSLLPIKPSPNLNNDTAIIMYPTLGLFEGTSMSLGRGTSKPFQVLGSPNIDSVNYNFKFKPTSTKITKKPKYQDTTCYGINAVSIFSLFINSKKIHYNLINSLYKHNSTVSFFTSGFNYHSGDKALKNMIIKNYSNDSIENYYKNAIESFKKIRKKYLIYIDF